MIATVPALSAQVVAGVVRDSAGRALSDAEVIVEPAGDRIRTDLNGRYRLRTQPRRQAVFRVRLVGYRFFEDTIRIPVMGTVVVDVRLAKMPQLLATVTITERNQCDATSLSGFECRRASGTGYFRDAGELRSMRPQYWADMLDGMPGLRREFRMGPYGRDWRAAVRPSRCLVELWNGQLTMEGDGNWRPDDVIAIEYYATYADAPSTYKRFAWEPGKEPCSVIVYWLRGAAPLR